MDAVTDTTANQTMAGEVDLIDISFTPGTNDNVTHRKRRSFLPPRNISEFHIQDEYLDDVSYLDNIRYVLKEEINKAIDGRMAEVLGRVLEEKILNNLKTPLALLSARLSKLEESMLALTRSPLGSATHTSAICPGPLVATAEVAAAVKQTTLDKAKPKRKKSPKKTPKKKDDDAALTVTAKQPDIPQARKLPLGAATSTGISTIAGNCQAEANSIATTDKVSTSISTSFAEAVKKPSRRVLPTASGIIRGSADPLHSQLKAAEQARFVHLYNVAKGTTDREVNNYVQTLTGSTECTVESIKTRGNYASFKLGVPLTYYQIVMNPEKWPLDICIKPWVNFRSQRESNNNQ